MYQHSRLELTTWAVPGQSWYNVSTMYQLVSAVGETVSGWYNVSSMYQLCINIVASNPQRGQSWYNVSAMYQRCVHTWVWSVTPSRVDTLYHRCIINVSTMYQHSHLQPATWAELIQCIIYVSTPSTVDTYVSPRIINVSTCSLMIHVSWCIM